MGKLRGYMPLPNEVRSEVLEVFASGEHLSADDVMRRTGRRRVVYRYLKQLRDQGVLIIVRADATRTIRRKIYALASSSVEADF